MYRVFLGNCQNQYAYERALKYKTRLKSKVFSLEIFILLIWTNFPRTNVAWTTVVVTVVICCICFQDPMFKA